MSENGYAKSVLTGGFVGVLLALLGSSGFFIYYPARSFVVNLVIGLLVVVVPLLGIYLEGEDKRTSAIMLVLFVATVSLISCPFMDEQALNNMEWRASLYNVIEQYEVGQYEGKGDFLYEPSCYTTSAKVGNTSIIAKDYYYRGFLTFNPYYSVPQALHKKLTCGHSTSIGAYFGYKDKLESQGFKVEETESGFTATNETTAVHCYLDGKHLVVAKTSKNNIQLINKLVENRLK